MQIEVATHPSAATKTKGDLLELLSEKVLQCQHFTVQREIRRTASELDLHCEHKVSRRTLYVECKAQREPLSANELTKLLGNLHFHSYDEAWLISAGPLGKDAKGFQRDWELKPVAERQRLSIYTPERIVELLCDARFIVRPPDPIALQIVHCADALGDWTLLVTEHGLFWAVIILKSRVPASAMLFDAKNGAVIRDSAILRSISETDSSLSDLNFETEFSLQLDSPDHRNRSLRVIEVETGVDWADYRPARPEHFVGRKDAQDRVISFLQSVLDDEPKTRVFAITGDSGMGKSSLITKLRDRCSNIRHRGRFFLFAVDVRAASEPGYVIAALLMALSKAAEAGFGRLEETPDGALRITNHADPLSSPSVATFLSSLEEKGQLVCLVFDQFEELYSKPELFSVFEEARRLFFATIATCANLVLGFAWKTDTTVQQGHPAYFMWHQLADHRFEVSLLPFTHKEASSALTHFEKEISTRVRPELRRQVIEISQGLPWLCKKLCVHIWENLQTGVSQEELADTLEVSTLFDRDLQVLSTAENGCLKAIAKGAPADWYEILETYGEDVLRSLQHRRLVVRSGDRLNLYWDIFRDYVLTQNVPSLPFTYLPSSPSLRTMLRFASQLGHGEPRAIEDIGKNAGIGEGTAQNIAHDLVMFGVATGLPRRLSLDERVESADDHHILLRLRQVLQRHALMLRLTRYEKGATISQEQVVEELKFTNRAAQHSARTWHLYADRILRWLHATGLLAPMSGGGWRVLDRGDVHIPKDRRALGGRFLGDAPPERVVSALIWLNEHGPQTINEIKQDGFRNSITVLSRFRIVGKTDDRSAYEIKVPMAAGGAESIVWQAASKDSTVDLVVAILDRTPTLSAERLAEAICNPLTVEWKQSTKRRVGNGLRRWAGWILAGRTSGKVPTVTDAPSFRTSRQRPQADGPNLFKDDDA